MSDKIKLEEEELSDVSGGVTLNQVYGMFNRFKTPGMSKEEELKYFKKLLMQYLPKFNSDELVRAKTLIAQTNDLISSMDAARI